MWRRHSNPSIIAREGKKFEDAIKEIAGIVGDDTYISARNSLKADEMVSEHTGNIKLHSNTIIKIPMCAEGLKAVSQRV